MRTIKIPSVPLGLVQQAFVGWRGQIRPVAGLLPHIAPRTCLPRTHFFESKAKGYRFVSQHRRQSKMFWMFFQKFLLVGICTVAAPKLHHHLLAHSFRSTSRTNMGDFVSEYKSEFIVIKDTQKPANSDLATRQGKSIYLIGFYHAKSPFGMRYIVFYNSHQTFAYFFDTTQVGGILIKFLDKIFLICLLPSLTSSSTLIMLKLLRPASSFRVEIQAVKILIEKIDKRKLEKFLKIS